MRDQLKRCKQPKNIRVGSCFYSCSAYSFDDGTSTVDLDEWVVRSIRRKRNSQTIFGIKSHLADFNTTKYVNLARKTGYTWNKGKWAKSIRDIDLKQVILGGFLPCGIYTTKLAAVNDEIKSTVSLIERAKQAVLETDDEDGLKEWQQDVKDSEKELKLLKGFKTRLKNKSKAVK